jgi:hypothetical protein
MVVPFTELFNYQNGFVPDGPEFGDIVPNSAADGSNAWYHNGVWISDRGTSSAGSSGGVSDLQVIENQHAGCVGAGNIWSAYNTKFFVGNAVINGVSIGNSPGILSLLVGATPTPAGIDQPNAPTFAASATSGRLNGAYTVVVQALRQTTGALSSRSNPSATISVASKKGTLTFPSAPTGTTHWVVSGSYRGVPQGPWYRVTSQAIVPVATASIEIDWVNGELGGLAEINYDEPPACTHVAALGSCVLALGTGSGGYGVRPSLLGKPEAYPPELGFDLPVRGGITGVQPGVDGVVLVSTANGLMALLLSGQSASPILPRVIFGNVGFARSNSWCAVYDQIYGFSNKAGMVRTQGGEDPDSSFARPVQRFFMDNNFTSASTIVVQDQAHDAVIVASGSIAVPYMRSTGVWSAPITLPGSVSAGVALGGVALLQVGSTVYTLDTAGAGGNWFLRSPYSGLAPGYQFNIKTLREWYSSASQNVTIDLLGNHVTHASIGGLFPYVITAPFGALGARCKKPNRNVRELACRVSGSTGGQTYEAGMGKGWVQTIAA